MLYLMNTDWNWNSKLTTTTNFLFIFHFGLFPLFTFFLQLDWKRISNPDGHNSLYHSADLHRQLASNSLKDFKVFAEIDTGIICLGIGLNVWNVEKLFLWVRVAQLLAFVENHRLIFFVISFWQLYCLSFLDLRLLKHLWYLQTFLLVFLHRHFKFGTGLYYWKLILETTLSWK